MGTRGDVGCLGLLKGWAQLATRERLGWGCLPPGVLWGFISGTILPPPGISPSHGVHPWKTEFRVPAFGVTGLYEGREGPLWLRCKATFCHQGRDASCPHPCERLR